VLTLKHRLLGAAELALLLYVFKEEGKRGEFIIHTVLHRAPLAVARGDFFIIKKKEKKKRKPYVIVFWCLCCRLKVLSLLMRYKDA